MEHSSTTLVCPRCGREGPGPLGTLCPDDGAARVTREVHAELGERRDRIIGRVVAGRFPVVGLIGRGAYGTVYRAIQQPIGREVALKVMNTPRDGALRARFFREANVVARLSHPSTVTLFDYGEDQDGLLWMVLELIRGRTLRDVILEEAPLPPARAARLTLQVLGALVEAHGAGLVHRDLKPANIMLTREQTGDERAKVLDFGMAKVLEDRGFGDGDEATRTGLVVGTPRYLSPEQALARQVGPPTDVYALGVVLYEMLSGEPPFVAPSTFELLVLHTTAEVPALEPALTVPPAMEAVIAKAMAKAIEDRFADAQAMLDALRAAAVGAPDVAGVVRPPPAPEVVADPAELSADDLRSVARQAGRILPESRIAADLRSNRPSEAPPPTPPAPAPTPPARPAPTPTSEAPPRRPLRPGPSTFQPPPLAPDALDHGVSATHGELNAFANTDEHAVPTRGRLGPGLVAVGLVAVGLAAWLLISQQSPDPPERGPLAMTAVEPGAADASARPEAAPAAQPDAAQTDAAQTDAAQPDAAQTDAAPPPEVAQVRAAIDRARSTLRSGGPAAVEAVEAASALLDALIGPMPDDEQKAAWNLERAALYRRLARQQSGDAERRSLLAARADLIGAMTYGSRETNFDHYREGLTITEKLFGEVADETLAFACDAAHIGEYLHRGNMCAVIEIRAGKARLVDDPPRATELICAGAERFAADLPGLSEKRLKRKRQEKADYGAQCNLARRGDLPPP